MTKFKTSKQRMLAFLTAVILSFTVAVQSVPTAYAADFDGYGVFTSGAVDVYYWNQAHAPYAYMSIGASGNDFYNYGCGPTALATVITSLTGEIVNPKVVGDWMYYNGYYATGGGTRHSGIAAAAEHWGLTVETQAQKYGTINEEVIKQALREGKLVVALVANGYVHFKSGGHYVTLRGVDEAGNILIADPARTNNSLDTVKFDLSRIVTDTRSWDEYNFWIIGNDEEVDLSGRFDATLDGYDPFMTFTEDEMANGFVTLTDFRFDMSPEDWVGGDGGGADASDEAEVPTTPEPEVETPPTTEETKPSSGTSVTLAPYNPASGQTTGGVTVDLGFDTEIIHEMVASGTPTKLLFTRFVLTLSNLTG